MDRKATLTQLVSNVEESLRLCGIKEKTVYNYQRLGFRTIQRFFNDHHQLYYDKNTLLQCISEAQQNCESGITGANVSRMIRKSAELIIEYYETGTLIWGYLQSQRMLQLNPASSSILLSYAAYMRENGSYSASTIRKEITYTRQFMLYCEEKYSDLSKITKEDVLNFIPYISPRYSGGLDGMLTALRSFGRYLNHEGLVAVDISLLLQIPCAKKKRVKSGFSHKETEQLLSAVDQTTICGKRDYAMMLLAISTGLRSVDIINLKLTDINWHRNEILVVQQKTKRSLVLPLEVSVGNAIAHYILHGRPASALAYIFLRSRSPYSKLDNRTGWSIVKRYAAKAGIHWEANERKGFHSFRRSIGTWMLETGTSLSTISDILGHSRPDATKPYLSINQQGLLDCALGLCGIEAQASEVAK